MGDKNKVIVAIGDMHLPFISKPVFDWVLRSIIAPRKEDIHAIVQMGDLYDFYSFSRFPKRMQLTPEQETSRARAMAEKCWARIHRAAPKAKLFQIKGNHDARLMKRVVETAPELEHLISHKELFEFPNVTTLQDDKDSLKIWDWHFIHGFTKPGKHVEAVHFKNVCCAHTHRGGSWTYRIQAQQKPKLVTELNAGFMGNPFDSALIYRPMRRFFNWTWGVGIIDSWGGRFVPYPGAAK